MGDNLWLRQSLTFPIMTLPAEGTPAISLRSANDQAELDYRSRPLQWL